MSEVITRLNAALEGRYRIERELGAGGMATVYLAEDLKHDRKVALKVLKPELAAVLGADRFVVEIKTTASLQHPHILPLFDSGTADGFLFYVMPFIDGETLRDKLDRETQLGVEEAVRMATEIADALHYAHEQGVIHRDIKPENILLANGRPMVADFGIALAVSAAAGGRMTETGLSLGTPYYMSPEQATADKEISARSDVYSLASVLYEMLTGEPPHMGNSAQQIIMKIIADTPRPVTSLRKSVPPNVAAAVAKALEKLPADRFTSAKSFADALGNPAFTIAGGVSGATLAGTGGVNRRPFAGVVAIAVLAAVAALWGWLRPGPAPGRVLRYEDTQLAAFITWNNAGSQLAISPDGRTLAYAGGSADDAGIYIRARDDMVAMPLAGSEGVRASMPFFSPDSRRVGFCVSAGRTPCSWKVADVDGGPAVTLAEEVGPADGASWGTDGTIYVRGPGGLNRIPEAGGGSTRFTVVDTTAGETIHRWPAALPNGKGVLFIAFTLDGSRLAVADEEGNHRLLDVAAIYARYASTGHVVYVTTDGTLLVAPFDQDRLEITGESRVVGEGVGVRRGNVVDLDLSTDGALIYSSIEFQEGPDQVVWVDREGTEASAEPWIEDFGDLALSPDGSLLVVSIRTTGVTELWVRQGEAGPLSRLTYATDGPSAEPAWTPDGRSVAYVGRLGSERSIRVRRADGSTPAQTLFSWNRDIGRIAWTPDGTTLIFSANVRDGLDIFSLRPGLDSIPTLLLAEPFSESDPAVSPDGRWLAYTSDESGRRELYVRPFPDVSASRTRITSEGASRPRWSATGDQLLYVTQRNETASAELRSVDFFPGPPVRVAAERVLLSQPGAIMYWGMTPDGQRFPIVRPAPDNEQLGMRVIVVENWFEELKAIMSR